jgi:hypothetical protein
VSYRDDPRWLAAQERYVADKASTEKADEALLRRMRAAMEMHAVESALLAPALAREAV